MAVDLLDGLNQFLLDGAQVAQEVMEVDLQADMEEAADGQVGFIKIHTKRKEIKNSFPRRRRRWFLLWRWFLWMV